MRKRKIILSRKGFDGTTGGKASPIYNNRFISIPIPHEGTGIFYKNLNFDKKNSYIKVMKDLGINMYSEAHLDPDLRKSVLNNRHSQWRAIFGQSNKAQTHLLKNNLKPGDLFLFFGWFKKAELSKGKFKYQEKSIDVHAIFGYLEIGDIIKVNSGKEILKFAQYHPHVICREEMDENNTLYLATQKSSIDSSKPGAACFKYNQTLVLTKDGENKSVWELPICFKGKKFNAKMEENVDNKKNTITIKPKGRTMQEVFISDDKQIIEWATNLIKKNQIYD